MANQCQMVLMHLKKYGSITHLEAGTGDAGGGEGQKAYGAGTLHAGG